MDEFRFPPRKNGFELPFNGLQVGSWIIFIFDYISFFTLYVTAFEKVTQVGSKTQKYKNIYKFLKIFIGASYVFLTTLIIFFGIKCTLSDPTDPVVYIERKAKEKKYSIINNNKV